MNTPLIWLNGQSIMVDKIAAVDFTKAEFTAENRVVTILLVNGIEIEVTEPGGINLLIHTFIPKDVQEKYKGKIQVVRN